MTRYDVVVIGAGLGGLTAGAILAREGCKVLVIERSNSVGGAASTYKVGDLFVEGSLHETSDPRHPGDPKHSPLTRSGVIDTVTWVPSSDLYEVRGGPIATPLTLPASFIGARDALIGRFPEARGGIEQILREIEQIAVAASAPGVNIFDKSPEGFGADWSLSLQQKLDKVFGSNEAVKCALCANLAYYHDDPATLWWVLFAVAQGSYLSNGACYVKGGSQRLSSALARAIKQAGSDVILRRNVRTIAPGPGGTHVVTHTAKDGSDPQSVEAVSVVSNAAPETTAALLPDAGATTLRDHYAKLAPSISLFALTLGLSKSPREFGVTGYSTQILPPWMTKLSDYAQGTTLMSNEPADRMPPLAMVDYAAIDAGVPAPPYVLSIFGPDRLSNWDGSDIDLYRARRERWQAAIIATLDGHYPGLAGAVTAASFNTALSVQQYLNAPLGAVYGFAPLPPSAGQRAPTRSPRTPVAGLYLSSAYANFGGYTGVIQGAAMCADMILGEP
ncbi:MAG: dependent oxidoreductase [Tardiphaga sp.]|nr:dependent oxidoreductase [Tardiphaga sp.]